LPGDESAQGRRGRSVAGVENLWGRCGCVGAEHEFLQDQVAPDLVEGRGRHVARDDGSKMVIPLVQPSKNVEDEVVIRDGVAEAGYGVSHALHLATVVDHREVALDKVAEHGIEVKRVCFSIADELVLDRAPNLARGDAVLLGNVLKLVGDRAEDPGEDDSLYAVPGRVVDGRIIGEDMVGEIIALLSEQNLIAPAGVGCRRRIQNSQDKRVNVLYPTGLHVEHGNDGGIIPGGRGGGTVEEEAVVDASNRAAAAASASRAAVDACSSLTRRAVARTWARALIA
jgi:hypothetical protein